LYTLVVGVSTTVDAGAGVEVVTFGVVAGGDTVVVAGFGAGGGDAVAGVGVGVGDDVIPVSTVYVAFSAAVAES
jgi:hypothetical protein